jgi:uncharacterized protein YndB with AHSA1/START domain
MNEQATEIGAAVRHSVTVPIPPEQAFELFTNRLPEWFPADYSLVEGESAHVFEARAGGRWYERGADGEECEVGRVLEWEPPARVLIAWQLNPNFEVDPDRPTDVEVMFEPDQAGTRVTLEHRGFEVHGDEGEKMRDAVGGHGGWPMLLDLYAKAA